MAVQAQFGGLAGCLLPYGIGGSGGLAEEQLQALLSPAATGNKQAPQQQFHCAAAGAVASAAQSELTCNGNGGAVVASRKRGRDGDLEPYHHHHHHVPSSSSTLLPLPGMMMAYQKPPPAAAAAANVPSTRFADSLSASTSGRGPVLPTADALLAAELLLQQQGAEVDALVRAGCARLRAGLERARKRQCDALARAASAGAARALREKEAELDAARRRAQELEERLRQAAVETQAWYGLARSNEAAASGLRATLDALLLRAGDGGGGAEEGFGESCGGGADDDAESCCFVDGRPAGPAAKWACRACGGGEASVLVLPCRHLCLCKACEARADACPVCSGDKNAAIHIAPN